MLGQSEFLKKPIVRTILLAIAIPLMLILIVSIWLKIYSSHGSSRPVPDIAGLVVSEANEILQDKGLVLILTDSVYQQGGRPGAIIDQNPKAGKRVKKNRKIYVTINAFQPEMIEMPNVVGVSRRQAKSLLESYGLSIGQIKYVPDIAFDNVLHQRYKGKEMKQGDQIAKGSKVDLILGRGQTGETALVPELTGLPLKTAQAIISDSYLNIGVVLYDKSVVSSADSFKAIIFKQKPTPEAIKTLRLGSHIDVWLTIDSVLISKIHE